MVWGDDQVAKVKQNIGKIRELNEVAKILTGQNKKDGKFNFKSQKEMENVKAKVDDLLAQSKSIQEDMKNMTAEAVCKSPELPDIYLLGETESQKLYLMLMELTAEITYAGVSGLVDFIENFRPAASSGALDSTLGELSTNPTLVGLEEQVNVAQNVQGVVEASNQEVTQAAKRLRVDHGYVESLGTQISQDGGGVSRKMPSTALATIERDIADIDSVLIQDAVWEHR